MIKQCLANSKKRLTRDLEAEDSKTRVPDKHAIRAYRLQLGKLGEDEVSANEASEDSESVGEDGEDEVYAEENDAEMVRSVQFHPLCAL